MSGSGRAGGIICYEDTYKNVSCNKCGTVNKLSKRTMDDIGIKWIRSDTGEQGRNEGQKCSNCGYKFTREDWGFAEWSQTGGFDNNPSRSQYGELL